MVQGYGPYCIYLNRVVNNNNNNNNNNMLIIINSRNMTFFMCVFVNTLNKDD